MFFAAGVPPENGLEAQKCIPRHDLELRRQAGRRRRRRRGSELVEQPPIGKSYTQAQQNFAQKTHGFGEKSEEVEGTRFLQMQENSMPEEILLLLQK